MKKTYIAPCAQTVSVRVMTMIAASDSINSDYLNGVSYGGVDEDGTIDPSSRRGSIWDDDEETE
jgi:hypothetical protein